MKTKALLLPFLILLSVNIILPLYLHAQLLFCHDSGICVAYDIFEGNFGIGHEDGRRLTYAYSDPFVPWDPGVSETHFVLKVDDGFFTNFNYHAYDCGSRRTQDYTMTNDFRHDPPQVTTIWELTDSLLFDYTFRQILTPMVYNGLPQTRIEYEFKNNTGRYVDVGLYLYIDVKINRRDDPPMDVGWEVVDTGSIWNPPSIPYFYKGYENFPFDDPTLLVAQGFIRGGDCAVPDLFAIGHGYGLSHVCWEIESEDSTYMNYGSAYHDVGAFLRWDATPLAPGLSMSFVTYYGIGKSSDAIHAGLNLLTPDSIEAVSPCSIEVFVNAVNADGYYRDYEGVTVCIHLPDDVHYSLGSEHPFSSDTCVLTSPSAISHHEAGAVAWLLCVTDPDYDGGIDTLTWRAFVGAPTFVDTVYDTTLIIFPSMIDTIHTIEARVRDAEGVVPIPGIIVNAYGISGGGLITTRTTNASGFAYLNVPEGVYALVAHDPTNGYYPEFYEEARVPGLATPVEITAASPDTVTGFDFTLDTVFLPFTISGSIRDGELEPVNAAFVIAVSSEEGDDWMESAVTRTTGEFEIYVPPGEYYLLGYGFGYIPVLFENELFCDSSEVVSVTDFDVDGIDFTLARAASYGYDDTTGSPLEGRVLEEVGSSRSLTDSVPLPGARVYLKDHASVSLCYTGGLSSIDGRFAFDNLPEGNYRVVADKTFYNPYAGEVEIEWGSPSGELTIILSRTSGIAGDAPILPEKVTLRQNYPNPFNSSTVIIYSLPTQSEVKFEVYNVLGEKVETLVDEKQVRGTYLIRWQPDNLGSGIYLGRLITENDNKIIRILYIK
ncbi:T9SS type A sorting domain-containing protein [bacterium]|nr:T9SS type A sorting domain-containing protein [bacterium]